MKISLYSPTHLHNNLQTYLSVVMELKSSLSASANLINDTIAP